MNDFYPEAFQLIIVGIEGVHSDDPADPGGDTWYGLARRSHPTLSPWPPTLAQAQIIYRPQYWDANRCAEMPRRWAFGVFAGAVNEGTAAATCLEEALGTDPDGKIGPDDLAAIAKATDEQFAMFMALQAIRYSTLAGWPHFGKGWMKRLFVVTMDAVMPS